VQLLAENDVILSRIGSVSGAGNITFILLLQIKLFSTLNFPFLEDIVHKVGMSQQWF